MATKSSSSTRSKSSSSTRSKSSSSTRSRGSQRADKSVEAFRDALERSVTLSRERIQEVADEAVERGRMTRKDANDMVSKLLSRSRQQRDDLIRELESVLTTIQKEVGSRTDEARKRAEQVAERAVRVVRDLADEPAARVDELRRKAGAPPSFPITGYDQLTAAQVKKRLSDLDGNELRSVEAREKKGKARKGVLDEIKKQRAS